MCFSPEASFASGVVVGGVGLATLTKIRSGREVLLGALPLLFAAHQIQEGLVWLSLEGRISVEVGEWCIWLYTLFAHGLLIAICPWSIFLIEPDKRRRRWLVPLLILGTGLCVYSLWTLSGVKITAAIRNHGIEYEDPLIHFWWYGPLYYVATCGPPFLSSYPWMITFGALNVAALIGTAAYKLIYLTSLWCALAAVISILIYVHFRRVRRLTPAQARL